MTSSFLKDDLLGLKNKLESIEKEFEEKLKEVEDKTCKFKKLDEEIDELVNTKNTVVRLNVGGKIFQTKISTLLGVKDTLFYKLISRKMENKEEINNTEFFFDRSYLNFSFILDYLRTRKYSLKNINKFELEDLTSDCEYYGLTEILNNLNELQREIEFVTFESSPKYSTAGTHKVEDLKDKSLTKGICVESPYHIIIELNFEHEINMMEIAGWNGNSSMWCVGNGANAKVSTSTDKFNWKEVGSIPSNYGATIQRVNLTNSFAKYIKFKANSYLGIGYLNIFKA